MLKGVIVLVKPSLLKKADEAVDVRQYGLENSAFPQQTTVDQCFDEAQFESYRRLGIRCVKAAFTGVTEFKDEEYRAALNKEEEQRTDRERAIIAVQKIR